MSNTKLQTLKGFRDFLPQQMRVRNYVLKTLQEVFESFGFEPLQTPTLEYAEVLTGKYGDEADKLMYLFKDQGGREVGLNYDLTVPTSRVLAQYSNQLPLPFKRYQIQPAYRSENTQKGRYRQFIQCDIDTFGVTSPLADAEVVAVIFTSLKKLGFDKFKIRINSRQVLFDLLKKVGVEDNDQQLSILQSVDKLDKKSETEVKQELTDKGVSNQISDQVLAAIKVASPDDNLKQLFEYLDQLGVGKEYWEFVPSIVRGLDYYTGPIFETVVEEPKIGSITGGGRYDNLVEQLGGPAIPATGTTIGFDRICDVIEELGLLKDKISSNEQILVTVFDPSLLPISLNTLITLRKAGVNAEIYLDPEAKLEKQLKYADQKGVPYVIIIGPDEVASNTMTLKNLQDKTQEKLNIEEVIKKLKQS